MEDETGQRDDETFSSSNGTTDSTNEKRLNINTLERNFAVKITEEKGPVVNTVGNMFQDAIIPLWTTL